MTMRNLLNEKREECGTDSVRRYYFLKELGICVSCGKNAAIKGKVLCGYCQKKWREAYLKKRKQHQGERIPALQKFLTGFCERCGKILEAGETEYCAECQEARKGIWTIRRKPNPKKEQESAGQSSGIQQILCTPNEAAMLLQLKEATLANWRRQGIGPAYARFGRHIRYKLADIEKYVDEQKK